MGDQNIGYTLDEALSTVGFGTFQGLVLVFAGLGWVADAMEMTLISFIGPTVKSEWTLSPAEESLLTTAVFGGMLVGAFFWGFISDVYGRRMAMQGSVMVIGVSGLLSAFSPVYMSLIMYRCFLGFGVGGVHVFPAWFLEFISTSNRGALLLVISTFWTLGSILGASLSWIVIPSLGWRWLLEVPGLIVAAILVDRLGRKLTMEILTILAFILVLPLLTHQNELVTTASLFGARMFVFAATSTLTIYTKEVYPTSARGTGCGLSTCVGRVGGMVCPLVAVGLVRGCHQTVAVILFEVVVFVSGFCVLLFPIETNGKDLTDIVSVE